MIPVAFEAPRLGTEQHICFASKLKRWPTQLHSYTRLQLYKLTLSTAAFDIPNKHIAKGVDL